MPIQIRIRPSQLSDLSILRDIGAETIQSIIDKWNNIDPPPIRISELKRALDDVLSNRTKEVSAILGQVMSLYTIRRQRELSAEDLLEGILYGITTADSSERWNNEEISRWKTLEPQLRELFSLSTIWTVAKAMDLSYDHANLLQNIKIINDVRPIYDEDASNIDGAIISYNLRLYFDSIEGSKSLTIAMDENDVKDLQKKCERALRKAKTIKNFMLTHEIKRTFICGEEE